MFTNTHLLHLQLPPPFDFSIFCIPPILTSAPTTTSTSPFQHRHHLTNTTLTCHPPNFNAAVKLCDPFSNHAVAKKPVLDTGNTCTTDLHLVFKFITLKLDSLSPPLSIIIHIHSICNFLVHKTKNIYLHFFVPKFMF